jgi:copper chaperone CopZ
MSCSQVARRKLLLGILSFVVLIAIPTAAAGDDQAPRSAARAARVTYRVSGMRCHGCAAKVREGLSKLDGVVAVSVGYEPSVATVEFRPSRTDPATIRAAIVRLGFKADQVGKVQYPAGEKPPS